MNHQYPITNPLYNLINPNPNLPNPQFNFPQPPQFPPPPPPPQPQLQNPFPDLHNSLSSLKTLIQSSNSTLQSLSSLFPSLSLSSSSLIQCPSNPNHWVPSSSLFRHSLSCPSPLEIGLEALQYPKTLIKDQTSVEHSKFVQPISDHSSELCFSIDDYVDLDCNFFYQDCPGVVSSSNSDVSNRIFTLPSVLSVECANFVGCIGDGFEGSVKTLPSEVWFVAREVEKWSEYPIEYSFGVVKAVLCVEYMKECDLSKWVIENSPRFGVVVDVAMRDHICVLCKLCLKAIVREAAGSYRSMSKSDVDDNGRILNFRSLRFKCPILVEVMRWLTLQISILYGEIHAKALVIALVGHLLCDAASNALLFCLDRKSDQYGGVEQSNDMARYKPSEKVTENECNDRRVEQIFGNPIFLKQIAAAIAALHERSLLERRIRALRNPPPLTAYQRSAEHSYFSEKAHEERQKRPDYRPLIDHDGLANQRQNDQGSNKPKTKEELLAEERDYKRRRMSYRGKKSKRSAKEVMRDIIEEYMEAIKQTGGIGGPAKEDSEGAVLTSTHSSCYAGTSVKLNQSSRYDMQDDYRTLLEDELKYQDTDPTHTSKKHERHKMESYLYGHSEDRRTGRRDRSAKSYHSRSPSRDSDRDRDRRYGRSSEHRSYSRNRVIETSEDECSKRNYISSKRSRDNDSKVRNSASSGLRVSSGSKDKRVSESPDRYKLQNRKSVKSNSFERAEFSDRYDPSEARDNSDSQFD